MEISPTGAPAHTRLLSVRLEAAPPGRARVHGQVLDLRKRGLVPMSGDIQTAGVIHDMRLEALLSTDPPHLESIRAEQPTVAFEPRPGTAGECCRDPVQRIEALADSPLDALYPKRLSGAIGGPRGCSHVLTLAQLLGSTAATALDLEARVGAASTRREGERFFERNLSIDGLETPDQALALVLQLADVHFAPSEVDVPAFDRLGAQREVRVVAEVDLGRMTLRTIDLAERTSGAGDLVSAPWIDRSPEVAALLGRPVMGGMAPALFGVFGEIPEDRPLLDTLLNVAPALIQCIPAVAGRWQTRDDDAPSMFASGGMADSCYMWRRGGGLEARIARERIAAERTTRG